MAKIAHHLAYYLHLMNLILFLMLTNTEWAAARALELTFGMQQATLGDKEEKGVWREGVKRKGKRAFAVRRHGRTCFSSL